jgi:hypothetical protein
MASFLICERRLRDDDPSLARAMAVAHLRHERPRCLCTPDGIEMYVAKAAHGFVLKRMPYTGLRHAALCRSHGSPTAPRRTRTRENRTGSPTPHVQGIELIGAESRLLRNFVTSLWHRAELTRWQPGFDGDICWRQPRRATRPLSRGSACTSRRSSERTTANRSEIGALRRGTKRASRWTAKGGR